MHKRQAGAMARQRYVALSAQNEAGSTTAELDRLFRDEGPRLARFFNRRLRGGHDAPDLVQEAFTRLASFMARDGVCNAAPYLQRIARNLLYERTRRQGASLSAFHLPLGDGQEPAVRADQEDSICERDVMRIYRRALDELPEKTRTAFLLHRVDELTYREISEQLGISVPTVQYHIARCLAHLDAALESE